MGQSKKKLYSLQQAARQAISDRFPSLDHRIFHCHIHRSKHPVSSEVQIKKSGENHYYSGLQTCGSVWSCPVCASKIAVIRALEIDQAFKKFHELYPDGTIIFVTHTIPHYSHQSFKTVRDNFLSARRKMRDRKQAAYLTRNGRRCWKTVNHDLGYLGDIYAFDVTVGDQNGWHPHSHDLYFFKKSLDHDQIDKFKSDMLLNWIDGIEKSGIELTQKSKNHLLRRSVQIRVVKDSTDYQTKLAARLELTQRHSKTTKTDKKRYTPFSLLLVDGPGKYDAARRFAEFATAQKGKNFIKWSQSLKSILCVNDLTDEETATADLPDSESVYIIDQSAWLQIIKLGVRGKILDYLNEGGNLTDLIIALGVRWKIEKENRYKVPILEAS